MRFSNLCKADELEPNHPKTTLNCRHKEVMGPTENRLNIISCHGTFTQKNNNQSLFRKTKSFKLILYKQASNSQNSILKLMRSKTKIPRIPITLVTIRNKSQQTLVFVLHEMKRMNFSFEIDLCFLLSLLSRKKIYHEHFFVK